MEYVLILYPELLHCKLHLVNRIQASSDHRFSRIEFIMTLSIQDRNHTKELEEQARDMISKSSGRPSFAKVRFQFESMLRINL